jgi:glycosyl-4,4'-diaponeurosporenoate acyltransferase
MDLDYLERFGRETCRGEAVHWVVLLCASLFFLWNPWWAGLAMVVYALIVNVPCILAQRYNRIRLARVRQRRSTR